MLSVPLDYVEYLFKMLKIHAKNVKLSNDFNVIFPYVTVTCPKKAK